MKKAKVTIFIATEGLKQRFLRRGAFRAIDENFEATYVFPGGSLDAAEREKYLSGLNVEFLDIDIERMARWQWLTELTFYRFRNRHASYKIRVDGVLLPMINAGKPGRLSEYRGSLGPLKFLRDVVRHVLPTPQRVKWKVLSWGFLYDRHVNRELSKLRADASVQQKIEALGGDIIVCPTSLSDFYAFELGLYAQTANKPVLFLQSNWDNVSSKSFMFFRPHYLAVWGEQSKKLAVSIQKFEPKNLISIGAAQFEEFRLEPKWSKEELLRRHGLDRQGVGYIFYCGCARTFDDLKVMEGIDAAIEAGKLPPLKIIFRPHPLAPAPGKAVGGPGLKNVVLDAERNVENAPVVFYDYEWLNALHSHASVTIAPMSTTILEAATKGVPVVALNYSNERSFYSPDMIARMEHCLDLWNVDGIFNCGRDADLPDKILAALDFAADTQNKEKLIQSVSYLVEMSEIPYGKRLRAIIADLLTVRTLPAQF